MRYYQVSLSLILVFFIHPPLVEAHIIGGATQETQGYRFQFVTDPPFPMKQEEVFLVFSIQNASNGMGILNVTTSVTILNQGEIVQVFEDVKAPFGDFAVSHTFEKQGSYAVRIELRSRGEEPSAQFPMRIEAGTSLDLVFLSVLAGIAIVIVAILFFMRWRNS